MDHDAIFQRLPHRGPMLFLDAVVALRDPEIVTETRLTDSFILCGATQADGNPSISPLICLELFAQSAAALMAHRSARANAPAISGALLGTRKFDSHVDRLMPGQILRTTAREIFGAGALAQFQCTTHLVDGESQTLVAEGSINVAAGQI